MKVVHVCKSFYPNIGGEEKYIYQLAKEQIKSGLDVTVLTRGSKEYEVKDGIKIHRVDSGNKPVLRLLKSIFLMKEKLKEIEADVYHAHDWNNALICDFARKEFVTTVHGYGFLDEFWLTRWIAEATLSGSKRLIVNHKFLVDKYKRYNPKYIHAGISLEEYPYKKIKKNNI